MASVVVVVAPSVGSVVSPSTEVVGGVSVTRVKVDEVVESVLRTIKNAAATPVMRTSTATSAASTMTRVRLPEERGGGPPGGTYGGRGPGGTYGGGAPEGWPGG